MRNLFFTLLFTLLVTFPGQNVLKAQVNEDSLITSIVSRVQPDSVEYIIQSLQDFQTRFMFNYNRFLVVDWLVERFISLGFTDVERDSFMCTTSFMGDSVTLQVNVIATLPGTTRPDEVYIIGGHYDCFSYNSAMTNAPGADDNASGTSSVFEFARVLMESGYQPEATIRFIAFGAEELMLFGDAGCEHYAQEAYNNGMDISLMINCDMISYNTQPLGQATVNINYYAGFSDLLQLAKDVTNQFTIITGMNGAYNQFSDSYPFYEMGYPAVYFEESEFSPFYHTTNDLLSTIDIDYCSEVIKASSATLLKYMFMNSPTKVSNEVSAADDYILYQNYPNPFNPSTSIRFTIPESGNVVVKVYNLLGSEVATLLNDVRQPGTFGIDFNASGLPSGTYFCRISAGNYTNTIKMILLK